MDEEVLYVYFTIALCVILSVVHIISYSINKDDSLTWIIMQTLQAMFYFALFLRKFTVDNWIIRILGTVFLEFMLFNRFRSRHPAFQTIVMFTTDCAMGLFILFYFVPWLGRTIRIYLVSRRIRTWKDKWFFIEDYMFDDVQQARELLKKMHVCDFKVAGLQRMVADVNRPVANELWLDVQSMLIKNTNVRTIVFGNATADIQFPLISEGHSLAGFSLCSIIEENTSLININLGNWTLDDMDVFRLFDAIKQSTTIQQLTISLNSSDNDDTLQHMHTCLQKHPSMRNLCIYHMKIDFVGDFGCDSSITCLGVHLSRTQANNTTSRFFSNLAKNTTITRLDVDSFLRADAFGHDDFISNLFNMLLVNTGIQKLHIAHNKMKGDYDRISLFYVLNQNKTLQYLDFYGNNFNHDDMNLIFTTMILKSSIMIFRCSINELDIEILKNIDHLLSDGTIHTCLKVIQFDLNHCDDMELLKATHCTIKLMAIRDEQRQRRKTELSLLLLGLQKSDVFMSMDTRNELLDNAKSMIFCGVDDSIV